MRFCRTYKPSLNFLYASLVATLLTAPMSLMAQNQIEERIKGMDLKLNVPLGSLDVNEWAEVAGGYRVEISPNFDRNSYSRREKLNFRFDLGNTVDVLTENSGLGVLGRTSIDAQFIRQFPSQRSALSISGENRLYRPSDAPHSARKALALKPNDYYSVNMRTAFELSATTAEISGISIAGLEARYIIAGDFQLEVYRKKGSKVFVRASSLKENTRSLGAFLRANYELDLFAFDPANDFLEKQINVRVIDLEMYSKSKGKLFTIEFEYDLSKPKARQAYEELMNPRKWDLLDLAVINPLRGQNDQRVRRILKGKIEASEALVSSAGEGVRQQSQSETDYQRRSSGLKINLIAANNQRSRQYLEQDFQFKMGSSENDFERYKIATLSMTRNYDILLGWRERDLIKEATVIFELDPKLQIRRFDELSFSYQRSDIRLKSRQCPLLDLGGRVQLFDFCQDELPEVMGQIRKMLPESLHDDVDMQKLFAPVVGKPTFLDLDLIFSPEAMDALQKLSPNEIEAGVRDFVQKVRAKLESSDEKDFYGEMEFGASVRQNSDRDDSTSNSANEYYEQNIREIVRGLTLVLTSTKDKRILLSQWETLVKMQRNAMFRDLGAGIMVRLLDKTAKKRSNPSLKKLIFFQIQLNARGLAPVSLKVGEYERPEYTTALIRARNSILNREFDPSYFNE